MSKINKIKIVYVIPWLKLGGAERFLLNLLKKIDKDKFEVSLVCLHKVEDNSQYRGQLIDWGVKFFDFNKKNKWDFSPLFKLIKLLRQERPDIIHTQLFLGDFFGRLAAKLLGIKVVVGGERNLNISEGFIKQVLKILTAFITTKHVAITEAVKYFVIKKEGAKKEKVVVIPTGVDLEKFQEGAQARDYARVKIIIGSMGRLMEQKGHRNLIVAMSLIEGTDIECRIAGEGEKREEYEKLIKDLHIEKKVKLLGWQADARNFYESIDIFVMPSNWEGLGTAVLEAGATGLPVVASRVDGIKEVIENRNNGLLFSKGNYKELARKLALLIDNPSGRERLGTNLKITVEDKYDINKIVKEYEKLYYELV